MDKLHPVIAEWHTLSEQEQYEILNKTVRFELKCFGNGYNLRFYELNEIINETWLELQKKLDNQYIETLSENKNIEIKLNYLVNSSARNAIARLIRKHRKHTVEYGFSLNDIIGADEDVEIIETIADTHCHVEELAINSVVIDEMLSKLIEGEKTVLKYIMIGCTKKEIINITGFSKYFVQKYIDGINEKFNLNHKPIRFDTTIKSDFDMFSELFKNVLKGTLAPSQCMRQLNISKATYYWNVNRYKKKNSLPYAKYYDRQNRKDKPTRVFA